MNGLPEKTTALDRFLRKEGFECTEYLTEDIHSRWLHYWKILQSCCTNLKFKVIIRFEQWIHDCPDATYDQNFEAYFEEVRLSVYDRQMCPDNPPYCGSDEVRDESFAETRSFEEETEQPIMVDWCNLKIHSYSQLKKFLEIL